MSFDTVVQDIQDRLGFAARSRKSPMHTPVIGTSDGDLRVMVLREFNADTYQLRFHTDARSPKIGCIANDPAMAVLAYDVEGKVQIRMRGVGAVKTTGPDIDAIWDEATNFAKRCYLAEQGPSSVSARQTSGLPGWAEGINPTADQIAPARQNFAVLYITVTEFDWLYLANTGHRRARITILPDRAGWMGEWLVP